MNCDNPVSEIVRAADGIIGRSKLQTGLNYEAIRATVADAKAKGLIGAPDPDTFVPPNVLKTYGHRANTRQKRRLEAKRDADKCLIRKYMKQNRSALRAAEIAEAVGMSTTRVAYLCRELSAEGWIQIVRPGGGKLTNYQWFDLDQRTEKSNVFEK